MIGLIVTHDTRTQCLLNSILPTPIKIRIKNCGIIRIEISDTIHVEMIYSGELAPSEANKIYENSYYVKKSDKPQDVYEDGQRNEDAMFMPVRFTEPDRNNFSDEQRMTEHELFYPEHRLEKYTPVGGAWPFTKASVRVSKEEALDYTIKIDDNVLKRLNQKYVFYIVRHGQAEHNLPFATHLKPDTSLTREGQKQANNAGIALYEYMREHNEFPDVLFVSDLGRTHQTMNLLILAMDIKQFPFGKEYNPSDPLDKKIKALNTQEFVVLPCASEISELAQDGQCDLKTSKSYKKMALENYSRCTAQDIKSKRKCVFESNHPLNWSYYLDFYGQVVRSERFEKWNRGENEKQFCRNTSMLANILAYLNKPKGGTRKKRTRRYRPVHNLIKGKVGLRFK